MTYYRSVCLPSSSLKGREILIILTVIRFDLTFIKMAVTKERGSHQILKNIMIQGKIRTGGWDYKIGVKISLLPQFMQCYCVQTHLDAKRRSTAL